jgi:hypothetical protein
VPQGNSETGELMRRILLSIMLGAIAIGGSAEEYSSTPRPCCPKPIDPGYDSREASVLSMMGWGVGLCAGIAILCALLNNNPENN